MTIKEEHEAKKELKKILLTIIFAPVIVVLGIGASFFLGFVIVAFVWGGSNITLGALSWIATGVYKEVFAWTSILTRVGVALSVFIIFLLVTPMVVRRDGFLEWLLNIL